MLDDSVTTGGSVVIVSGPVVFDGGVDVIGGDDGGVMDGLPERTLFVYNHNGIVIKVETPRWMN